MFKIRNYGMLSQAFFTSALKVTDEHLIIRKRFVLPTLFLLNISTAHRGTYYLFLFVDTVDGVVSCDGSKK